jgi:hypothetical protein
VCVVLTLFLIGFFLFEINSCKDCKRSFGIIINLRTGIPSKTKDQGMASSVLFKGSPDLIQTCQMQCVFVPEDTGRVSIRLDVQRYSSVYGLDFCFETPGIPWTSAEINKVSIGKSACTECHTAVAFPFSSPAGMVEKMEGLRKPRRWWTRGWTLHRPGYVWSEVYSFAGARDGAGHLVPYGDEASSHSHERPFTDRQPIVDCLARDEDGATVSWDGMWLVFEFADAVRGKEVTIALDLFTCASSRRRAVSHSYLCGSTRSSKFQLTMPALGWLKRVEVTYPRGPPSCDVRVSLVISDREVDELFIPAGQETAELQYVGGYKLSKGETYSMKRQSVGDASIGDVYDAVVKFEFEFGVAVGGRKRASLTIEDE